MTSPLSQEARAELVAKAKAARIGGYVQFVPASTILAYEDTVVAAEAKLAVQAGARLAWPQAARDELAAWEEKHDLYVVSSDHHAGFVDQVDRLTEERDASLERVKEADEFAAFVARHSGPARRAGLSDKEFRSIVEHHPAVQDLLTKSTEQEDG